MIWKELIRVALLGTDKASLAPATDEKLQTLGIPEHLPMARRLLTAAAIVRWQQKAGFLPNQVANPTRVPAFTSGKVCSDQSAEFLQRILEQEDWRDRLLPELITAFRQKQLVFPPELLPELLQLASEDADIRPLLLSAFGPCTKWLASLHPNWKLLFSQPLLTNWDTANHTDRLRIFEDLYVSKPPKAIEQLNSDWPDETYRHKLDFLSIIEKTPLQLAEAFLEDVLDDKRKEVSQKAASILSLLPNSRLSERMYQRAQQFVGFKSRIAQKPKLAVQLPEETDPDMLRDGIHPARQWSKGGLKATRLLQILSKLSPDHWNELLQCVPSEGMAILARSEWSELLVDAIIQSTASFQDKEWTDSLLFFWINHHDKPRWYHLNVAPLFPVLDDALYSKMAQLSIRQAPSQIEEDIPATHLLKLEGFRWTDKLCFMCIKKLQEWVVNEHSRYWNTWPYQGILQNAAFSCSPSLFDYFYHKWPRRAHAWMKIEEEVEEFLEILRFRKEMLESLEL